MTEGTQMTDLQKMLRSDKLQSRILHASQEAFIEASTFHDKHLI